MSVDVQLRDRDGHNVRALADPSGGTFDAAGDFDRFLDHAPTGAQAHLGSALLSTVDIFGVTEMHPNQMDSLLEDIARALPRARPGAEFRGLLRLQVLAQACAADADSVLVWVGD